MAKVHIIGAGLAGLAAGVKLINAGKDVVLYEASPQAGGRCRSYYDETLGQIIDNGNHLILGANRHALEYIKMIGAQATFIKREHPRYHFIDFATGERFVFKPLWALQSLMKLAVAHNTATVSDYFNPLSPLFKHFVEPFCLAALNTEPRAASAILLRRTLWEILKNGRRGLDYYLPKNSLSQSLIEPAIACIEKGGGTIHYRHAVKTLQWSGNRICALQFADESIATGDDNVILATTPHAAQNLVPQLQIPTHYNAIVNGHFLCPDIAWPADRDCMGILGSAAHWLFYRNNILSTTTSAANDLALSDNTTIAQLLWEDICKALRLSLPLPPYRILCERRATHASRHLDDCHSRAGRNLPVNAASSKKDARLHGHDKEKKTKYANLFLAGDYTEPALPATIDSAVKSGFAAASRRILA